MRRTLLKTGIKNAFLRSVSTPEDRSKAPNFCVWDALEIIILITGVLFAMRYLVR